LIKYISEDPPLAFAGSASSNLEEAAEAVRVWFSPEGNGSWPIILDSCDALETESGGYNLEHLFPDSDQGSIIITARRKELAVLESSDIELCALHIFEMNLALWHALKSSAP
jgi:hypothetical protein